MDFEEEAEYNEKPLHPEDLEKKQGQHIKELVDIVKECEELLSMCRDVFKYIPASSITRKRIDAVLKDISQLGL